MTVTIIILSIVLVISVCLNIRQLFKEEKIVDELELIQNYYEDLLIDIKSKVSNTLSQLIEVDIKGSFEADDEVGFTFKNIKDLILILNEELQKLNVVDNGSEEK